MTNWVSCISAVASCSFLMWCISSGVVLVLAFFGVPFVVWAIGGLGLLWAANVSESTMMIAGGVAVVGLIRPIRRYILTAPIFYLFKVLNIFPKVSDTERIALEAGTVWVDGELFSGKPNLKKILSETYPKLTRTEKAFLDGPVEELCKVVDDWNYHKTRKLPKKAWDIIKKEKLFGMIIPKKYGGLELSPLAHSAVISKLSSRSSALGITVMVPNSLGPAELLVHYGTTEQKDYYLPRLATGEEIPCFGLTEPTAGSDAGAMKAKGEVFKRKDGSLGIQLNFEKRWITLSGISTVIGLAFNLEDPKNLLGKGEHLGITCALIPRDTKGISLDTRHDPMGVPFYNCPIFGKNVEVSVDTIIGGAKNAGQGWRMLMESLSAGRGISLPANGTGGSKLVTRVSGAFAAVRQQFGLSIGRFEGVQEPLARMGGLTYMLDAARIFVCGVLAKGEKPAVVSAIMKYHFTEIFRKLVNDGLDVMGGAGISVGPRNLLANPYNAAPIGITVEGANILTRTMIIFGQGALRCHPYAYAQVQSHQNGNLKGFDLAFWGHVLHVIRNLVRAIVLSVSRGLLSFASFGSTLSPYKRRLMWVSASFATLSDICMGKFGGTLKFRESITGRLADILSWMYLITAVMRRFEDEGKREEDKVLVNWVLDYGFAQIQVAFDGLFENMGGVFKWVVGPYSRLNSVGTMPTDRLGAKVAQVIQNPGNQRDRLTSGIYIPDNPTDALGRWEAALALIENAADATAKIKQAVRKKQLPKKPIVELLDEALNQDIITKKDHEQILVAEVARLDAIQVDAFTEKDYSS